MKVGIFQGKAAHQVQWCGAFAEGLEKHGVEYFIEDTRAGYVESDLAVTWSHRRDQLFAGQRAAGKPYLVLERGFIGFIESNNHVLAVVR